MCHGVIKKPLYHVGRIYRYPTLECGAIRILSVLGKKIHFPPVFLCISIENDVSGN